MVLNILNNPLNFTIKVSVWDLTYIRRIKYLARLEFGVFIFLNKAMFVVKLNDLIPEEKWSTESFSGTNALIMRLRNLTKLHEVRII